MSRRSTSSSLSDLSKTATGLPLLVTTTGPFLVAFTYSAKSAATSFCVATFTIPPPLQRPIGGCLLSHQSPGSGLRDFLGQFHKARGNGYLARSEVPRSRHRARAAAKAFDSASPLL